MQRATCSTPDPTLQHAASERSHLSCLLQQASSKMQQTTLATAQALSVLCSCCGMARLYHAHSSSTASTRSLLPAACGSAVGALSPLSVRAGSMLDVVRCMPHLVPQPQRHRVHDGVHRQADRQRRRRAARARHRPDERRDRQPVEQPDALAQCGRPRRQRVPFTPESRLHTWRPAGRWSGDKTTSNEVVWRALTSEYSHGGLSTRTGVLPCDGIALL